MQSTELQTSLAAMIGFRPDGDGGPDIELPDALKTPTTGTFVDELSELLTLANLKRSMRLGLTDFGDYLIKTRAGAVRSVLDSLTIKLSEAGLSNQLLTPSPAFKTQNVNLRPQPKLRGRRVGIRIEPKLADVVVTIPRVEFGMSFIEPFDLVLSLREEGETAVLATITLHQTEYYKWHTVQLPPLARNTAYWLTYEEDSLSHSIDPEIDGDSSYNYVAYNTMMGSVRAGNCQSCRANCPGSYASIRPMYVDDNYRAQVVSDTNYGLNLTVSAQADLTSRLIESPLRLLSVYKLQLAITFLEKIAFGRRHNGDADESVQAALFMLTDKDNAERLPPKLEKAYAALIGSLAREVSPGLAADRYAGVDFETT